MADTELKTWLRAMCALMLSYDWQADTSHAALGTLLTLPRHLLHELMKTVLETSSCTLWALVDKLPVALHGSLISCEVTASGTLSLNLPKHSPLLIVGLNKLHLELAGSGLLGLHLTGRTGA